MTFRTDAYPALRARLLNAPEVDVGEWHAADVRGSKLHVTRELLDVTLLVVVPSAVDQLQRAVGPNLPWAEDHFLERVSGRPLNPAPSEAWWPYGNTAQHKDDGQQFSHTYPERFWPKLANGGQFPNGQPAETKRGIREAYGDLNDVVEQLRANPMTRQAVLPVFFPEDTGNVAKIRVPCSLTYHFMVRGGMMRCTYSMRSVDFVRHLKDDVYMAARLMQWISAQLDDVSCGLLTMHMTSLHVLTGDLDKLRNEAITDVLG